MGYLNLIEGSRNFGSNSGMLQMKIVSENCPGGIARHASTCTMRILEPDRGLMKIFEHFKIFPTLFSNILSMIQNLGEARKRQRKTISRVGMTS